MIYAVIDTNVLVSALLTTKKDVATARVLDSIVCGDIIPLYHKKILEEYEEVLHREKLQIDEEKIVTLLNRIKMFGKEVFPQPTGEIFIDMDDIIFYEVAMEKRDDDAYLVTGNKRHYPIRDFIVTPAEMIEIIEKYNANKCYVDFKSF